MHDDEKMKDLECEISEALEAILKECEHHLRQFTPDHVLYCVPGEANALNRLAERLMRVWSRDHGTFGTTLERLLGRMDREGASAQLLVRDSLRRLGLNVDRCTAGVVEGG